MRPELSGCCGAPASAPMTPKGLRRRRAKIMTAATIVAHFCGRFVPSSIVRRASQDKFVMAFARAARWKSDGNRSIFRPLKNIRYIMGNRQLVAGVAFFPGAVGVSRLFLYSYVEILDSETAKVTDNRVSECLHARIQRGLTHR